MRRFIILFILLVFIAGAWFTGRAILFPAKKVETIELVTPEKRDLKSIFRTSGRVAPAELTEVKSEVSGRIAELRVHAGDTVKRGDVLLALDQSELESEMRESERMIESSRLRSQKSQLDVKRKRLLHADKLVSEQQFEEAEIDAQLSENEMAVAHARLDTLRQKLAKTTIYAPHDGVILNLTARDGSVITGATSVSEGTKLMEVAVLDSLRVEANVNEVDIGGLEVGMSADLTFDSLPGVKAGGEVVFVSPSAVVDPDNKSRQIFPVTVGFKAESGGIRPGISAKIAIPLKEAKDALVLPVPVVFSEKSESFVYVKKGEGWERRVVETGIADGQFVQILSGVKEGEKIARTRPAEMPEPKP